MRCLDSIPLESVRCPHCGFALADLDGVFGRDTVFLDRVTDAARVLSDRDRLALDRCLGRFQRTFPQLFAAVYVGRLPRVASLREFGFWLLNRAAVASVDYTRPNDHGILFVVDVTSESAAMTLGYFVEPHLGEDDLVGILGAGAPALSRGRHAEGLRRSVDALVRVLKTRARELRAGGGHAIEPVGHGLEGIRDGHRMPDEGTRDAAGRAAEPSGGREGA